MVQQLPEELDGRLRVDVVPVRQVDVVHEDDELLPERRPVDALAPLVQLTHDDVLRGPRGGVAGEEQTGGGELVRVQLARQHVPHVHGFTLLEIGEKNDAFPLFTCR